MGQKGILLKKFLTFAGLAVDEAEIGKRKTLIGRIVANSLHTGLPEAYSGQDTYEKIYEVC
jgi:hypothetical protein